MRILIVALRDWYHRGMTINCYDIAIWAKPIVMEPVHSLEIHWRPTGDPLEAAAVGRVFGDKGIYIDSVSSKKVTLSPGLGASHAT